MRRTPLTLGPDDVIPTGNDVMALPNIRASDGALMSFNVLAMRERGLLEVAGGGNAPFLRPYVKADGHELPTTNMAWELGNYWIPTGHYTSDGLGVSYTYVAPPDERAAMVRVKVTNTRSTPATVDLGLNAQWGVLNRVTYNPEPQKGKRTMADWDPQSHERWFTYGDPDNASFAFTLNHPGALPKPEAKPAPAPSDDDDDNDGAPLRHTAERHVTLEPGASAEAVFIVGVGVDRLSSESAAGALAQRYDREGSDAIIRDSAAWAAKRTRTTGDAALDTVMNRNYLFTREFAWGRTIDTDQMVGITSRSPRYYVSAAYWDRDAMLWSMPALIDTDKAAAREALDYALTVQLHNAGTHSRFIDGIALESGFQLDEAAAPLVALASYVEHTGDVDFLTEHREALRTLAERLDEHRDPGTGLYTSLKDSQDEYQKERFMTYDNVLVWKTLGDVARLWDRLGQPKEARKARQRQSELKPAIMHYMVAKGAPGASGPIFAVRTDGNKPVFADVPPGSLLLLPHLGFIAQNDPLFVRTYEWLHSKNHAYAYADKPYGLPGSYRVPFTTSWSVADHLRLNRGRKRALAILRHTPWDGGIVTEGLDPSTAIAEADGRGFATAAGYVAHTICDEYCSEPKHPKPR